MLGAIISLPVRVVRTFKKAWRVIAIVVDTMKKGISPAVSYVMMLAIIVIISVSAYVWGDYEVRRLQDAPIAHNIESQMISIDQLIQAVSHGDTNFTSTMNLYYLKGIMQVDASHDWIKYTAELNANVYDRVTDTANTTCDEYTYIVEDTDTGLRMTRMVYTNVFRGGSGDSQKQSVEIVVCYHNIQINESVGCIGKSGPRAQLTVRKIGYNSTANKPVVEVRIC